MEYVIIEEENSYVLEQKVKNHLEKGYKLAGGVSTHVVDYTAYYCQAVYKEE